MSKIQRHHGVVFYPTFGKLVDGGAAWNVDVCGLVYAPGKLTLRSRLVIRALRRYMRVTPDALDSDIFRRRLEGFLALGERGRRVVVCIGDERYALRKKTRRNGQFTASVRLEASQLERLRESGQLCGNWLRFRLELNDEREIEGRAHLLADGGVSVVTDIDDTIKLTAVHCRRSLLANTFLHPFESIEGMSRLYRIWADQGAAFHYVSSSPWQLYQPLADFCSDEFYPDGTFHLRPFRIRDQMLSRLFRVRRRGKGAVIHSIVNRFPQRRFILVGDSGEKDPEIYASVARRFPDRVTAIYVRNLPERPLDFRRWEKVFRRVRPDVCKVFHAADDLPRLLPLDESALQGV